MQCNGSFEDASCLILLDESRGDIFHQGVSMVPTHTSSVERFSENFDQKAVTCLIFFVWTHWFQKCIVRHEMGLIIVNCSSLGLKYNFDLQKDFWPSVPQPSFEYRISSYSFRGNYSFLNLDIVANSNSCRNISIFCLINCGNYSRKENYSRAETIGEIRYVSFLPKS